MQDNHTEVCGEQCRWALGRALAAELGAQVGERDEADLEELTPGFFCLGYAKCIYLVSQETPLLPSWLGALA